MAEPTGTRKRRKLKYPIGYRHGMLTVIGYVETPPTDRLRQAYRVRCDCGNERTIAQSNINQTSSCGCMVAPLASQRMRGRCRSNTGVCGVSQTRSGKYVAYIFSDKIQIYLGTYNSLDDAIHAKQDAEIKIANGDRSFYVSINDHRGVATERINRRKRGCVYYDKRAHKWQASLRNKYIGIFATEEEARAAIDAVIEREET